MRGGKRAGAGRHKIERSAEDERRVRGFRVTDREWNALKAYLEQLRHGVTAPVAPAVAQEIVHPEKEERTSWGNGLTPSQERALSLLESGKNVFLTGGAGTGKTYLLHQFINRHKGRVVVAAPSGIAAKRAGGSTIHSVFRVPIKIVDDSNFNEDDWLADADDLKKMAKDKKYKSALQVLLAADIIVIDEISMCRADVFEYVAKAIHTITKGREANKEKNLTYVKPHKLQVVLCGDFAQLPPVITKAEKAAWKALYPKNPDGLAFLTDAWKALKVVNALLVETVRQSDAEFSQALNRLRMGDARCLTYLNGQHAKTKQDGPTICATNRQASEANKIKYRNLRGREHTFTVEKSGEQDNEPLVCEEVLTLKRGCKVILLVNDSKNHQYQNGSYGEVLDFCRDADGMHAVKLRTDEGDTVIVGPYTWDVERYELVDDEDEHGNPRKKVALIKIGEYTQIPLRLGWALTAHKSQGQDYDSCNVVAPQNFWAAGQLYVALSRAKDIRKLYLGKELTKDMLNTNQTVKEFYAKMV